MRGKRASCRKAPLYARLRSCCKRNGHDGPDDVQSSVFLPFAPAPPCRHMAAHLRRQLIPATSRRKHINHGFQRFSSVGRRPPAPGTRGNIGLELTPLSAGEFVRHEDPVLRTLWKRAFLKILGCFLLTPPKIFSSRTQKNAHAFFPIRVFVTALPSLLRALYQ